MRITSYGVASVMAIAIVAVVVAPTLVKGQVTGRDPATVPKVMLDAVTLPPVPAVPSSSTAIATVADVFQPPPRERRLVEDWSRLPPPPPFSLPSPLPLPVPEK